MAGAFFKCLAFLLIVAVQSTKIEDIFRIGVYTADKHDVPAAKRLHLKTVDDYRAYINQKPMWEPFNQGGFSFCQLPDSALTFCFVAVVSYIIYMAVAISIPAKPAESADLNSKHELKVLLAGHHFNDNIIPVKIRNAYDIGSSSRMEQTSLGTTPMYCDKSELKKPLIGNEERAVTGSIDGGNEPCGNNAAETEVAGTDDNGTCITEDKAHKSQIVTL